MGDTEMLDWRSEQGFLEDFFDTSSFLRDPTFDFPFSLENGSTLVNDCADLPDFFSGDSMNHSYFSSSLENGSTPLKDCASSPDFVNIFVDTSKETRIFGEYSPQIKRRRIYFDSEFSGLPSLGNVEISPAFPRPEETEDSATRGSSDTSQKVYEYFDSSSPETVDQPSDALVASYLNDNEMHQNAVNLTSGIKIDKEFCETQSILKVVNMGQHHGTARPRANVFRGRKSNMMQTQPKLASSIVCPFTFIKPCGVLGDMTLNDINQRILTPTPKLKGSSYPTSAFSGKPVVGRKTLSTDGGRGTITIMRTKG